MVKRILACLICLCLLVNCKSGEDYLSEGQVLIAEGNVKAALVLFEKAIEKNPFLKDAYIQLGLCHENLHQSDSALIVYNRLLNLYPDNTAAYYYSGISKYSQRKFKEAILFFNKAIYTKGGFNITDTTSVEALINLNKDNFQSELQEMDIPTREILYDRGMAYYKAGQVKNACTDFNNCIIQNYNTRTSYNMIDLCKQTTTNKKYGRVSLSSY